MEQRSPGWIMGTGIEFLKNPGILGGVLFNMV